MELPSVVPQNQQGEHRNPLGYGEDVGEFEGEGFKGFPGPLRPRGRYLRDASGVLHKDTIMITLGTPLRMPKMSHEMSR